MGIFDRIAGRLDELSGERRSAVSVEVARARALAAEGDVTGAERLLEELTDRSPDAAEAFLALGELHAARGALEEAIPPLGRAVDLEPGRAEAWCALGEALGRLGRAEPARDALHRALSLAIDPALRRRGHAALGNVHAATGRLTQAARELAKAVELAPPGDDDRALAVAYGRVLARLGEPEASEWLTRAARAENADPALFAEAARITRDPARAEALLREGLARAPEDAGLRVEAARLLRAAGRLDEALALARAATTGAPGDPRAWQALREALVAAGGWGAALEAAERETGLGAPPPFQDRVALALGAEDEGRLTALAIAPGDAPGDADVAQALNAWLAGDATDDHRVRLGRLAPSPGARRYVARPAVAAAPPAGDLAGLLGWTHQLAIATPGLVALAPAAARAAEAFDRPLLVAVMGEFNAGKSSFVNALCGADVAPTGVTPTTATINVLRYAETPETRVVRHDGSSETVPARDAATFLGGLGDEDARAIRSVDIFLPVEALRRVEIVDTPGLNAIRPEHERVARDFLRDADAIVWVFATGQAAKATERDALAVARAAGKRVIGVVNKIDLAGPGEVDAVIRHISKTLGDLVDSVIPFSATAAARARRAQSRDPGLDALTEALERRFLADARALKKQTALGALRRFVEAARAGAASPAQPDFDRARSAQAALARDVLSVLDAERVALGARIDAGYRRAAIEVRDFVQPRAWLFGENRASAADEEFLVELLEDAVDGAVEGTRAAFRAALASGGGIDQTGALGGFLEPPATTPTHPGLGIAQLRQREPHEEATAAVAARVAGIVDGGLELFSAYARGTIEAGVVPDFFRHQLPRLRLELAAIRDALARRAPSPEAPLFATLRRELTAAFREAEAALATRAADEAMRALVHQESLARPLEALTGAIDELARS
jgi:tetratricopeptide (TPR) repeat protein/GTP-binding protein EngB required for normal cell division